MYTFICISERVERLINQANDILMVNGSKKRTQIYELSKRLKGKERNRKKISDVVVVSVLTQLNEKGCSVMDKESIDRKNNTWHHVSFILSPSCIYVSNIRE